MELGKALNHYLWGLDEILTFTGHTSKTTAVQIKKRVLKSCGGAVGCKIKRDAVLKYFGTNLEEQKHEAELFKY